MLLFADYWGDLITFVIVMGVIAFIISLLAGLIWRSGGRKPHAGRAADAVCSICGTRLTAANQAAGLCADCQRKARG